MAALKAEVLLLRFTILFLCSSVCLCQRDCTGVDCPQLDNCIEEVLDSGSCCASCLQKGCMCEGYQYYDCLHAGFKNGKVAEGESYFVDYGSTECLCPTGGGRISCDFISCPDLPPNCIDVSEPVDGCMQCERVGCIYDGQKYDAGHSLNTDPCQVCHCPPEGGKMMCYPVPECDQNKVHNPMLAEPTDEDRHKSHAERFDQQGRTDQFSTPHQLPPNLPLFKTLPSEGILPLMKEESEDYDYNPTDFPEPYPQSLAFPTQSSSSKKLISVSRGSDRTTALKSFDRQNKLELRERHKVHEHPADREEVTESPIGEQQRTIKPQTKMDTTSWQPSQSPTSAQSVSVGDITTKKDLENPLHAFESSDSVIFPLIRELGSEKHPLLSPESAVHHQISSETQTYNQSASEGVTSIDSKSQINVSHTVRAIDSQTNQENVPLYMQSSPKSPNVEKDLQGTIAPDIEEGMDEEEDKLETSFSVTGPEGLDVPYKINPAPQEVIQEESEGRDPTSRKERITTKPTTNSPTTPDFLTTPVTQKMSTTQEVLRVNLQESEPSQKLVNLHSDDQEEAEEERIDRPLLVQTDGGVSAVDLLQSCCTAGQKWASDHQHCKNMPTNEKQSMCSVAGKQCCLSSLKEIQCQSGMTSARRGDTCEGEEDRCPDDSHEVCCSCCALGLQVRSEGKGCEIHQFLGYPCGHIFLTCCEEEEGLSKVSLRRKPRPTSIPREDSEGTFPREAFAIGATDETANGVEEQKDVDECLLHTGKLCQQTCTNTWGSFHCGCYQGFILQGDGRLCAPVIPDEENRVKDFRPAAIPTITPATTTVDISTRTTTSRPVRINPCSENGGCSQQCLAVADRALCSCFPGFRLKRDGRKCEDINECVLGTHNCGIGFVCENTLGSFLCNHKPKCITGFSQDSHGNCIDINECLSLRELCSSGFNCINTVGSFSCQQKTISCSPGYSASSDGAKCVDLDECQMGTNRCGLGQICHNLPGSYTCDCQTGYQYDSLRKLCTDINECWRFPGRLCGQTCENTPGSFHCSCTEGFSLALDGKNCKDINECDKKPCSQECANIYGSYQCYCRQGYHLKDDGHTCEDIDECSQSIGSLCTFRCVNVAGSYQCACPPQGFTLSANKRSCKDIDECTAGNHNCSYDQSCFNLQGGFRCLSFHCPKNYNKVSDTRCDRISCNSLDCQNSPVRITYYQLSFQTNIIIPAQIFRIGPSPSYSGDHISISIIRGNEEGFFSTRKLNGYTGAVFLQRQVKEPKDFLIHVEMKLLRKGMLSTFLAKIYVFITSGAV
ncbi:fibulin-2 [Trematomus bernacchii]|uniref:fibulin-2 n=1 Tax=Trematomus bernacchii TaxID=40690 RepID=UPI00146D5F7E|nr:fibulin-2 [Trematomus bernacchii]XP_033977869.1 fibulin-2 [Trematomus bernacchii]